jgi:hypothetical protein
MVGAQGRMKGPSQGPTNRRRKREVQRDTERYRERERFPLPTGPSPFAHSHPLPRTHEDLLCLVSLLGSPRPCLRCPCTIPFLGGALLPSLTRKFQTSSSRDLPPLNWHATYSNPSSYHPYRLRIVDALPVPLAARSLEELLAVPMLMPSAAAMASTAAPVVRLILMENSSTHHLDPTFES